MAFFLFFKYRYKKKKLSILYWFLFDKNVIKHAARIMCAVSKISVNMESLDDLLLCTILVQYRSERTALNNISHNAMCLQTMNCK